MDADQIARSKENIQPLRQGRVASQLSEALQAHASVNNEIQQAVKKKIHDFELTLHTYEGDDPLYPWVEYISWVEQYFPKKGKEGNFPTLLKKCLDLFKDSDMYKQDQRYVKLWIKYLDMQPEKTSEMYEMVLNHGIGTKVAHFYHSWAMELYELKDMKRADQVYCMGISAGAEPAEQLLQAHKNFQCLVLRQNINPETSNTEPDSRTALGHLHASGSRNFVPHVRTPASHPLQNFNHHALPATQTPAKFDFFKDENGLDNETGKLPSKQSLKSFPSRDVMHSENLVEPSKWTDCASHLAAPPAVLATPFKVHTDPIPATPNSSTRKILPGSVLKVRKTAEQPEWTVPLAIFEPHDPKFKPMYCKDKVYTGGIEFSLEELRAQRYYKEKKIQPSESCGVVAEVLTRSATVGAVAKIHLQPKLEVREPLPANEKLQVPEVCLGEPEVCMEEHLAKSYLRLRKAWEEKKAKQALATASIDQPKLKSSELTELTYEVPANSKLCVTYATFENGIEKSLEELRALKYSMRPTVQPNEITQEPSVTLPNLDVPLESKHKYMFDMAKYSSENGEVSFEERRAFQYLLKQGNLGKICSGASTPSSTSSQGTTTPSETPGGTLAQLSMLGQSMTVNTKEAMATMKDLWCSRYESPLPVPSPKEVVPFSIFQDTHNGSNAHFQIFSDQGTSSFMPENTKSKPSQGPKRGLQLTEPVDVKKPHDAFQKQMLDSGAEAWPLHSQSQTKDQFFSKPSEPFFSSNSKPTAGGFTVYDENAFSLIPPQVKCDEEEEMEHENAVPLPPFHGFDIFKQPTENPSRNVPLKDIFSSECTRYGNNQIQENLGTGFNFASNSRNFSEDNLFMRRPFVEQKPEEPMEMGAESNQQASSIFQKIPASEILPVGVVFPQNYEIPYVAPPDDDKVDVEEIPNKENVSPRNYTVPCEVRELSGILTEARNLHFIPLEEQERMLEEEDRREQHQEDQTELEVRPISKFVEDVTSMTSVFRSTCFMSSTPYHQPTQSVMDRDSPNCDETFNDPASLAVQVKDEENDECMELRKHYVATNWEPEDTTVQRCQVQLSPILEVTGESRGSRSGSSGGSGGSASSRLYATTASSLHGFSKTPGQFSKTPGQFSKTPGQFSYASESHAVTPAVRPVKRSLLEMDEEYNEEDEKADNLIMPPPPAIKQEKHEAEIVTTVAKLEPDVDGTEIHFASLSLGDVDDPFCNELQRKLLSSLKVPFDCRPGFEQFPLPLPVFKINSIVSIGKKIFKIKKCLGEGAYAKVYLAKMEYGEDKPIVLKVAPEDLNCWDFYISSEIQKRLPDPTLASMFNSIKGNYLFNNGVIYEMDFVSPVTLLDVTNHQPNISNNLVEYLVLEVLEIVHVLHQMKIIHADIKPDNFLVMPSQDGKIATLQLIDFGRCIDMSLFPKGTSFTSVFKSTDFRCIEMRTHRPWTYQLDLFGMANTIHCVIFNKYMTVQEIRGRWKTTSKVRRYWELAEFYESLFDTLLNVSSCDELPDLLSFITFLRYRVKNFSDAEVRVKELSGIIMERTMSK